jgi:hypothetical protein
MTYDERVIEIFDFLIQYEQYLSYPSSLIKPFIKDYVTKENIDRVLEELKIYSDTSNLEEYLDSNTLENYFMDNLITMLKLAGKYLYGEKTIDYVVLKFKKLNFPEDSFSNQCVIFFLNHIPAVEQFKKDFDEYKKSKKS